MEFQRFEPKSDTALADLFNNTPAIRAAFTTVDPTEFNNRLDNMMRFDPVMGVKSMHALGSLSRTRPALPQLADAISSIIDRFARYYQATPSRQSEYNAAIDLVNRLLDVDPRAITDGSYLGARSIKYIGESASLFPMSDPLLPSNAANSSKFYFPALTTWKTCNDPGSVFLSGKPLSDVTDLEGRDTLWSLYDVLRTGFCIYANRSGPRVEVSAAGVTRQAAVEATLSNSGIVSFQVIDPGAGYTGVPIVNIDATPGPGSGATATATLGPINRPVLTIAVPGSGYSTAPTVTVNQTECPGTQLSATVTGGVVTAVDVTAETFGCSVPTPTITVSAPDTAGTTAVVTATTVVGTTGVVSVAVTAAGAGYVPKNDSTPGAYMRNATAVLKNSGDIEVRIRNLINDLNVNLADYTTAEKRIADWTVNQSAPNFQAQVAVTDYLIDHIYPITRKDFVFNLGKEVLDREAEHLSMKDPEFTNKYLTEWLLESLATDAPKLDALEDFSQVDATSKLYVFGKDMVENSIYGIKSITSRYPKATMKQHFWGPTLGFDCNCGAPGQPTLFKGLLSPTDGYLTKLAKVKSTENILNPFRNYMSTRVNALVPVAANYGNELYLESALKNFYFHILERYYDQTTKQWAFTADDADLLFPADPNRVERNLQSYIGQMQYSMRNMAILDKTGKKPGDGGFDNIPYLTAFLYTIAAANGYIDPVNAPGQLTLQTCLYSMGATDIADNGIRTINIALPLGIGTLAVNSQVANAPLVLNVPASTRNNEYYSTSLNMFAFELISPGRFIPRADTESHATDLVNGKWRGVFSSHQGDIESTGLKTSNWMVSEFSLSAWEGYGPYSVKGRAANGSKVKYENDYYTDAYKARIGTDYNEFRMVPMGTNGGNGGALYCNANENCEANGNMHVYEMIYRPKSAGDDCWVDSQGSTYGYARYGYIRPQNDTSYTDTNNCLSWQKVRIDFETRDEVIRANVDWVLKYKKYVFVIPMAGHDFKDYVVVQPYAGFAVFSTIHGNGLWGVTTGKRACGTANCNGLWNVSGVNMGANGDGDIPNSGPGFRSGCADSECPGGGQAGVNINLTTRLGRTSFAAGDSMVLLDKTFRAHTLVNWLVDLNEQIWDSLGDGPVTPAMIKDNFDSVLTLANALYATTDVLSVTVASNRAAPAMSNFSTFYNTFFPTDETSCVAGALTPGANGQADLFENFTNGCGVTARDLPPIPKVNPNTSTCSEFSTTGCIKYPRTFTTAGAVATWYDYIGPSDGKLTGMLTPLIMLFGTMHEDGQVQKVTTYPAATAMSAGENRDNITIRNFCAPGYPGCANANLGYRVELDTLFTGLASLNESKMFNNGLANNNLPQYSTSALTNILTESAAGLRNGFVPKMTNNKYANVAYIDPLVRDIEAVIADNVRKAEDGFEVMKGTNSGAAIMKNKDKLRYLTTKNVVNPTIAAKTTATGVVSADYHGLEIGDKVRLTGTLPAGTSLNTDYWVVGPITADNFRLSGTYGGGAIALGLSASYTIRPSLFQTNRFNASVNGIPLNSVPINMMKQFISYLRTLTSDADIVAAIKAAIPMLNNYLLNVQGSNSKITLTDQDIDHVVDFVKDTNISGDYSVDSFLDMIVSTKMDDLNTLRSFSFNQFKTLGSYQTVFDDINDKVNKYFEVNIKKDLLYSPFMLGEPTCPGGAQNGFYDHNKDGVWDPGTFTFISTAYVGATTFTDTANVNGSCTITTQVPNIYDKDYYMLDMGGVARNIERGVDEITVADVDSTLNWLYGRNLNGADSGPLADVVYQANPDNGNKVECYIKAQSYCTNGCINFDNEVRAFKNLLLCKAYTTKFDKPHYDRNGNNIIEAGEFTDVPHDGSYSGTYNGVASGTYEDKNSPNAVNLRDLMHYYLEGNGITDKNDPNYFGGMIGFYNDYKSPEPLLSPNKNYIKFATKAMEDLFAPTLCNAQGLNCASNPNYLTGDLLKARATFYASTNFTPAELRSVKNVVGNFLYDVDTGDYTNLMQRIGPSLVTLLREFEGDYNDLLNMGLEGFKPTGFLTYFSTNLKNKAPYTSLDILTDVRTLFNSQTMRCYPGITGDSFGGPSYCKKYKALDTFWGQFGLMMDQFSTAAYNKYKGQWQSQMADPYYARLASIFQ